MPLRHPTALLALTTLTVACSGGGGADPGDAAADTARETGRVEDARDDEDSADDIETPDAELDAEPDTEDAGGDATDDLGPLDSDDGDAELDADDGSGADSLVCTPGVRECVDGTRYHRCEPGGDAWGPTEACPGDRYCQSGRCLDPDCIPRVMFAIDGSESMVGEWDAIRGSVRAVVTANPGVAFGLSMFPVRLGCAIGNGVGGITGPGVNWPHVPIQSEAGSVLSDWFDANDASGGGTPLVATIEWFANNAAAIWGEPTENGYLVVMSEGVDMCRCEADEIDCQTDKLGAATAALLEAGVRTYVIGYRFDAAPEALNAIATNGGTEIGEFVPAGDEATLTDAFQIVIDDAKLCE